MTDAHRVEHRAERPGRSRLWLRALAAALAAVGGFNLVCAVLSRAVAPVSAGASERADWLREQGGDFDTIFVGSSRTFRQLVPAVFDRTMAELSVPARSFNLGSPGMRPPEDAYLIESALSGRKAPLRLLVVECNTLRLEVPAADRGTTRAVYWHDAARMAVLWRRVWSRPALAPDAPVGPATVLRHLFDLADHAVHWAWNASRVGRGAELLEETLADHSGARAGRTLLGPRGDGYFPRAYREPFHGEELERYRRALAAALEEGHQIHYGDVESQAELVRKRELAERYGARLVLLAPPLTGRTFAPLPESGLLFLDFSDPRRFPELFAAEHRNDGGHLNAAGAEIYTRLLARHLAARLADGA